MSKDAQALWLVAAFGITLGVIGFMLMVAK